MQPTSTVYQNWFFCFQLIKLTQFFQSPPSCFRPVLQSQFRFDNECNLNLPENHKRVSQEASEVPQAAHALTANTDDDAWSAVLSSEPVKQAQIQVQEPRDVAVVHDKDKHVSARSRKLWSSRWELHVNPSFCNYSRFLRLKYGHCEVFWNGGLKIWEIAT